MKKYLFFAIFLSLGTSIQAFDCDNKVEGTHRSWQYTYSKCTGQEPASQEILAIISLIANTIENDKNSELDEVPELPILLPPLLFLDIEELN